MHGINHVPSADTMSTDEKSFYYIENSMLQFQQESLLVIAFAISGEKLDLSFYLKVEFWRV